MASTSAPNTSALDQEVRKQLLDLLRGGQAHASFDDVVSDMPANLRGIVPDKLPYSAWQILEHMRITQRDILNFSAPPTGGYHAMQWPDDYWPKSAEPPSPEAWDRCVAAIRADREQFEQLLLRPEADLAKPFRWGDGQNLLREALLIADHTAYHLGELLVVRRLLGAWKAP
ncbi:MAG: DinB family protein [Rhodospirillales bacterium]|nr:DinB family protein [Acetobacter sp.]